MKQKIEFSLLQQKMGFYLRVLTELANSLYKLVYAKDR